MVINSNLLRCLLVRSLSKLLLSRKSDEREGDENEKENRLVVSRVFTIAFMRIVSGIKSRLVESLPSVRSPPRPGPVHLLLPHSRSHTPDSEPILATNIFKVGTCVNFQCDQLSCLFLMSFKNYLLFWPKPQSWKEGGQYLLVFYFFDKLAN